MSTPKNPQNSQQETPCTNISKQIQHKKAQINEVNSQ